ncbi:hypothetical protein FRC06_008455 [Ceratobasidium sp. 370]|nr:hypothetical protein FRC06_008455 [Ceratobasidium sp. 370]
MGFSRQARVLKDEVGSLAEHSHRVPALNSDRHSPPRLDSLCGEMGNKKNAKKSANTKNSTTNPSEDSSEENSSDSGAHLDGSGYSWLAEENLEYVDDPELYRKCRAVVDKVYEEGLDYGYFNRAVNYGNKYKESRANKVLQRARSEFRGDHLIPMLRNVRFPPRAETKGRRTKGAAESIDKFALSLTARRLREEMRDFEEDYENIKSEALSQQDCLKSLTQPNPPALISRHEPSRDDERDELCTCIASTPERSGAHDSCARVLTNVHEHKSIAHERS